MSDMQIGLLVVDDHPIVRQGIVSLVSQQTDLRVLAEVDTGAAVKPAYQREQPDVVLLDLRLPDYDGIEVLAQLRGLDPNVRALVLTTYDHEEEISRSIQGGAQGFLLKDAPPEDLLQAIRVVAGGGTFLPKAIASKLVSTSGRRPLTPRELRTLQLMAEGLSNDQIGKRLLIQPGTVKAHVNRVLAKLGASNRTHAVALGVRLGKGRI